MQWMRKNGVGGQMGGVVDEKGSSEWTDGRSGG